MSIATDYLAKRPLIFLALVAFGGLSLNALLTDARDDSLKDLRVLDSSTSQPIEGVFVFSLWVGTYRPYFLPGAARDVGCLEESARTTNAKGRVDAGGLGIFKSLYFADASYVFRNRKVYKPGYRIARQNATEVFLEPDRTLPHEQRRKLEDIFSMRCPRKNSVVFDERDVSFRLIEPTKCSASLRLVKEEWEIVSSQIQNQKAGCTSDERGTSCPVRYPINCIS